MVRWIRRFYRKKAEVEGIEAFHSREELDQNPYDIRSENASESYNSLLWEKGWNRAFMWRAARFNLPEYQDWENVTKAGFGDSDTLRFLFILCPRRFRYGWENNMMVVVIVPVILVALGLALYERERGIIGSIEGVWVLIQASALLVLIMAAAFFGWRYIRKKPLHLVVLIIVVWLGLLVTDTKVLVWRDSVRWFESICGNDCTIVEYDYEGKTYNIEVSDGFLNLPQTEQETQIESRINVKLSTGFPSMVWRSGPIGLGKTSGYLRCTYFNGKELIDKDYNDYYRSCPLF